MCGIWGQCVARAPHPNPFADVLDGLNALQYRGYDSCGVAWLRDKQGACAIERRRAVGAVDCLRAKLDGEQLLPAAHNSPTTPWCAIAHTRWATHGDVQLRNTHPHVVGEFALVHNGVVRNAAALRERLLQNTNHRTQFESDTDSELIAHLLAAALGDAPNDNDAAHFAHAMRTALAQVDGAYAVAVLCARWPGHVAVARRHMPLTLASVETGGFALASDADALRALGHFCFVPGDDDVVLLTPAQALVWSADGDSKTLSVQRDFAPHWQDDGDDGDDNVNASGAAKNADDGLCMWREMHEQPAALKRALRGRVHAAHGERVTFANAEVSALHWQRLRYARNYVFIACGTSYHAALAARLLFEQAGKRCAVERAAPFLEAPPLAPCTFGRQEESVFVFVSQSGETADTLDALRVCRERAPGALCVAVVNAQNSTLARAVDCCVPLRCGREVGVASTKAYTSQIAVLATLAAALLPDDAQRADVADALLRTPYAVEVALQWADGWARALAERWRNAPSALLLGRGADAVTCMEGALKVQELAYVMALATHAGELKHGPLALVDNALPIVMVMPAADDEHSALAANRMAVSEQQVRARGGQTALVRVGVPPSHAEPAALPTVYVPSVGHPVLQSAVNIVPLQLLSYYWALARGNNVDRPRNLAKSVTVE